MMLREGGCRKTARSERPGREIAAHKKKEQRIPSCHIIFRLIYVLWRFVTVFRSTTTLCHNIAHSSSSSSRKSCEKAQKRDDRICRLSFAYKLIIKKCETETSCCCCWLPLGGAESDYKDEKSFLMHARSEVKCQAWIILRLHAGTLEAWNDDTLRLFFSSQLIHNLMFYDTLTAVEVQSRAISLRFLRTFKYPLPDQAKRHDDPGRS